ncbi:glycosyltransferase family 2 protein [Aquirufa sp.]|jgi:glycosyltransferase involved in cell wall biosynthesis|uniref:glycosyltransferase family 2 protein n=1 Tax=Aquirufa sp. TaxID=2676249 RepID=UPI0037BEBFC9
MQKRSVALCTFNGAEFLSKQLESIKQQTLPIHEMVVCDDGSSDETLAILERFSKQVPFSVQVHQNPVNLGSSKNFEKCIKLCEGDLIFLCDQDDVWEPQKVEQIVHYLTEHPEHEAVFSNATMIDQAGFPTGKTSFDQIEFTAEIQSIWQAGGSFRILLKGYIVTGAALAIKKRALKNISPVPNITKELIHDGWIALNLSINNQIGFINTCLIQYREHSNQQVGFKSKPARVSLLKRFTRAREEKLSTLRKKADIANAMLLHFEGLPHVESKIIAALNSREAFYRMRANLPANRLARIVPVIKHALNGSYKEEEGGKWWRPVLGDLVE